MKKIKKHKPSKCPFRGYDNGVFGCSVCMPIYDTKVVKKIKKVI